MEAFAIALVTVSCAVWVGAIVFQSAVVAPTVFADLDEAAARAFLRRLFPRFFKLGLVCGALMAAGLGWFGLGSSWTTPLLALSAGTGLMLTLGAISLWLVPRINAARDAGAAGAARFAGLHRASVLLTVVVMIVGIAVLALVASRAAGGLQSMPPAVPVIARQDA